MNSDSQFMTFAPDLIVETTAVCDRACSGCYAPNVVSSQAADELLRNRPDLFLTPAKLKGVIEKINAEPGSVLQIAFRGGEPTRNPLLSDLIATVAEARFQVIIETHGRWVLANKTTKDTAALLETIRSAGAIVKISFDEMHGLSPEDLRSITDALSSSHIRWCIAITESTFELFEKSRRRCGWVPDAQIIFQEKALGSDQLIRPRLGVVKTNGSWINQLTSKWDVGNQSDIQTPRVSGLVGFILSIGLFAFMAPQGASAADVHIGLASNFSEVSSSNSNPYGDYFRKGIQLAMRDSEADLKKNHLNIILDEFDYGTSQAKVAGAVQQAVDSKVVAVLGYNLSPQALIAAPMHNKAKLPMLSSSATASRLTRMGDYIHLGSFSNEFMGQTLAWVSSKRLKAKKAALIVAEDCAYCNDLAEAFESEFKTLGGTIVTRIGILDSQKDFSKVTSDRRIKEADVVVTPNYELNSIRVITSLVAAGINKPFLGGDGWGDVGDEFFRMLGDQKITGYSLSHWHPDIKSDASRDFRKKFVSSFGKEPNDTAVLAYDSMKLLLKAVEQDSSHTREGTEKALNAITKFEGVTGTFSYQKAHIAPEKSIVLLKVGKGKFEVVERITPHFRGEKRE